MFIARNDEEKRSVVWRVVMVVSTLVILGVGAYFVTQIFVDNPLVGSWEYEGSNVVLSIEETSVATVINSEDERGDFIIPLNYQLDREEKVIVFSIDSSEVESLNSGIYTVEEMEDYIDQYNSMATSFDYEISGGELVLSDREYGESYYFTPQ